MALASTSVHMVNGCPSVYVPRVSPSCILPLWEALQDQKAVLTHAPFKLLLLPWVSEHVRFCVCPLIVESVSYNPPTLAKASPTGLQSQIFWHFSSWCRTPGLGSPVWGLDPSFLGKNLAIVIIFQSVGHLSKGMSLDYITPPALQPLSLWFLFTFLVVEVLFCWSSGRSHC